jgi:hypothetical protein
VYFHDRYYYGASHPPCDICGDLGPIGDPDAIIQIPEGALSGVELTEIDCATSNQLGMDGQISLELCPLTPALAGPVCLCGSGDKTVSPTSTAAATPSSSTEEEIPTPAPWADVGGGAEAPTNPPTSPASKVVVTTVVVNVQVFAAAAIVFLFSM